MDEVLDYSGGKPGAANIKRRGYAGAIRYIGFRSRVKCTDASELADFTKHGLGMALVYEDNADDWRGGYDRGVAAAKRARDHADDIGFPKDRPIYMAVDRDVVTEAEFRTAMEYLRGAGSVLSLDLTGVYGEHDVCVRAAREGRAEWFWQCRAWSGTPPQLYAGRHLYQKVGYVTVGGVTCDENDVLRADWGQHNGGGIVSQYGPEKWDAEDIKAFHEKVLAKWQAKFDPYTLVDGAKDGSYANQKPMTLVHFMRWRVGHRLRAISGALPELLNDESKLSTVIRDEVAKVGSGDPTVIEEAFYNALKRVLREGATEEGPEA